MTNGFKIIGIAARTTNQNSRAQQDLGKLWGRFYSENIFDEIPNKISTDVVAIYTDYKSDFTEEYTAIIGVLVATLEEIPVGLIGREFEAGSFQQFSAKGAMPEAVANTWNEIWQKDKELNRKYSYDFEVYGAQSHNGANSEVEIYIGIT